jgi:hypothetical protein
MVASPSRLPTVYSPTGPGEMQIPLRWTYQVTLFFGGAGWGGDPGLRGHASDIP